MVMKLPSSPDFEVNCFRRNSGTSSSAMASRVWAARRVAVWIGLTSMGGSLCWFIAFTLQNAAYVKALGQVELMLSIAASTLFFRERISRREWAGMAVLALSILALVLAT